MTVPEEVKHRTATYSVNSPSRYIAKDITLSTKVHLVKAMVFPVVMYVCESWTVKKAESQRIDAFVFLFLFLFLFFFIYAQCFDSF